MKKKTTMSTKPLTQQQVDYIRAHVNDRPRVKVARDAGVSVSTLYRIVHENGGELRHDLSTKREGIEDTVRAYYPTMTAPEICARFGYSKTRVNMWARRLGVKHSAETEERIRQENMARLVEAKKHIDYKAMGERLKRKRRMDELRVLSGLPQRTRFKFAALSTQGRQTVWRMVRKHNYFQMDGEPRTLYYDGDTRRSKNESYYTKKYGLKFKNNETPNDNLLENQELHAD